jgi:hypothetical protein
MAERLVATVLAYDIAVHHVPDLARKLGSLLAEGLFHCPPVSINCFSMSLLSLRRAIRCHISRVFHESFLRRFVHHHMHRNNLLHGLSNSD